MEILNLSLFQAETLFEILLSSEVDLLDFTIAHEFFGTPTRVLVLESDLFWTRRSTTRHLQRWQHLLINVGDYILDS